MKIYEIHMTKINFLLNKYELPETEGVGTYWALGDPPTSCIGLETYGYFGLLRSLAVHPDLQGKGHAKKLVTFLERNAKIQGIKTLFLLTTTASKYFERQGYLEVPRTEAPAEIQSSAEFSRLCPASATLMKKDLKPTDI